MTNYTDYEELKDRLEMAEVLTNESDNTLEVQTVHVVTNTVVNVIFLFNDEGELTDIYADN